MRELRPYQQTALTALRQAVTRDKSSLLLQAPTGAGKTTIASAMVTGSSRKGKRCYFIVDTLELIEQTAERFIADGLDVGVIQADHDLTRAGALVQVCSIQTLRGRWEDIPESLRPHLVIIDEAHIIHTAHERIIEWARKNGILVVGLSATPYRKGLAKLFDDLVVSVTPRQLMDQGYLCEYIAYAPKGPDMNGVATKGGDFDVQALDAMMGTAKVVGDITATWWLKAYDRRTLIFVPSRANSRALIAKFKEMGIAAEHVDGSTPRAERDDIIQRFRSGEIQVLSNVAILTKGFDAPEVDCIILARPTKSLALHIQMIGRGLRTAPGKENCLILDHSGNLLRNGLPDDPQPTELDAGDIARQTRKAGDKAKTACEFCGFVSTRFVCPACKAERPTVLSPDKTKEIKAVEGELYYFTKTPEKQGKQPQIAELTPDEVYAMALFHARMKRWKDGWAYHFTKLVTNQVPTNPQDITPKQPNARVKNMIKHHQIKQAKQRQKERQA